jgi:hypothetical protein
MSQETDSAGLPAAPPGNQGLDQRSDRRVALLLRAGKLVCPGLIGHRAGPRGAGVSPPAIWSVDQTRIFGGDHRKDRTYVGGISRTVEHEGYRFDIGGHRFFSKSKEGGRPVERDPARRFHPAAADEPHLLRGQILRLSAARVRGAVEPRHRRSTLCMASFAKAKAFPNRRRESFEDWTVNQFGWKLYSIFFKTYTEKVWGMPCDEMSADWAAQRIKGLSLWGAVSTG